MPKPRLLLILVLALLLRLVFVLSLDPLAPYGDVGGDSAWFLTNGYTLVTEEQRGVLAPLDARFSPAYFLKPYTLFTGIEVPQWVQAAKLAPPPVYLLLIGVPQALLPQAGAVLAVRILQAVLSTATCYFAYRLALRLTQRENAALLAAFALAVSPAMIIEAGQILTETLFIFLLAGGIWLYVESLCSARRGLALLLLAGFVLGLATLTRAVLLVFPLGLAIHLMLVYGLRRGVGRAVLLLAVYALVVSTWTVYNVARWNRFIIAGEGLPAFLYLGAAGWEGPQQVDAALAEQSPTGDYAEAAGSLIGSDPLGWATRRVTELTGAYLQPHGTSLFPGESLRDQAAKWLREDRSPAGLLELMRGDAFWQKLALYLFHYTAGLAGLVGMWRTRRQWRVALPMIGLIAYYTLAHLLLYALPRYLFPTEVFWWVFAAAALTPHRFHEAADER